MSEASKPTFLNPPALPRIPGFTQVITTPPGTAIYIAGQVALDGEGQLIGPGDLALQTEQVFRNLRVALRAVGADLPNLVKLTTYLTDMGGYPVFREVRERFLSSGTNLPANTIVQVVALARPEFLVEVEAIAWRQ